MESRNLRRFEGRLFAEGGCLFMVVEADQTLGTARVSCRIEGQLTVIEMPYAEMARRVCASAGLVLDNLNSPESAERIVKKADGWHFCSREGLMGPYESEQEAASQLGRYVLSMQTDPPRQTKRAPAAAGSAGGRPSRRRLSDRAARASAAA